MNSTMNSEIFTFVFKTSVARGLSISCPNLAESSLRIFETTVQKNMTKRISPLNQNVTHGAAIVDFD